MWKRSTFINTFASLCNSSVNRYFFYKQQQSKNKQIMKQIKKIEEKP